MWGGQRWGPNMAAVKKQQNVHSIKTDRQGQTFDSDRLRWTFGSHFPEFLSCSDVRGFTLWIQAAALPELHHPAGWKSTAALQTL